MANVELKKIEKIYSNGFRAVKGIDLKVKDGEFMVLVGPSGCAKSTTLRMVAGLEEISGGELWIGENLVNNLSPSDRNIAMVFQDYALYTHMSVYDNMAYGLKIKKIDKNEIDRRVRNAAEILGLTAHLSKKPKAMSGGQRQRVAVGRTIVREPEVFLFDEPLSNLDAKLRVHMRSEITKIQKKLKTTMIYVTHDQVEAMTMGDRICVMNFGEIMQVAEPLELYERPANKFVATFIGSPAMNIIGGVIKKEQDKLFFKAPSVDFEITNESMKRKLEKYIDMEVDFGLRPEHILSAEFAKIPGVEIKGDIDIVELMGNEIIVHFKVGDTTVIARIDPHSKIDKEKPHTFLMDMSYCHFFDKESGDNITL
ncbi:MAG: sugar ABC transporter ATP-binding protein [Candidatus Muiribacterium halophilum]|uniref:Sugar ABC transporter ATP-binding protein n=1 Tax=Muiribacterium halophilum TaxID=2053465 RepID=A0A2N5ZGD3_MUIH1|nr:MAG: sugar ABC transporter ATP-binding protein [Candidatus Muirbacterium halophilum]